MLLSTILPSILLLAVGTEAFEGSLASRGKQISRRGGKADAASAIFSVIGGVLGNRIYQDYKYKTVYPMSQELGYRIEPTSYQYADDDDWLPAPHNDEIKDFPDWDYAYQIYQCIEEKQHDDPKFCVNEVSCCLGVDKACANLNRSFCENGQKICQWNPDASSITIGDHTHVVSKWLSGPVTRPDRKIRNC
ncbi:hypothetical protein H072_5158 [Dactylellina haptotyla CBS 200.50]|uniref:Uncharacterized protein n=1 Tax=Dactylellina haptotyla (strain CBS 200.50) TaxID=1284197 RepID=S8BNG6_DACHA|nr:hypothetical protein H072_5158 [Dactylellina haptotyla CBS 200.50]